MRKVISILLLILFVAGLVFSKWVTPVLQTAISWMTSSPVGAVLVAMSVLVLIANIINWLVDLGRVHY